MNSQYIWPLESGKLYWVQGLIYMYITMVLINCLGYWLKQDQNNADFVKGPRRLKLDFDDEKE